MTTIPSKSKTNHRRRKSFKIKRNEGFGNINIENLITNLKEDEIESLYNKKEILELKNKILIHRIKKLRNESALKIQNMWKKYQLRNIVHELSHKVSGCYTVYPEAKDALKMYIRIFTNELNKEEYKIMHLDFCPIRKYFLKDIPKNKFYTSKKIMYFNFIKNNKIFFDEKYEKVLYNNECVHKVDFSIYDQRQKKLDENKYNKKESFLKCKYNNSNSKDSIYLSTEDEKEYSENSILTPDKSKNISKLHFSFNKNDYFNEIEEETYDEYDGLRTIKRKCTNEPIKNVKIKRSMKRFKSFDANYSVQSKLISILKESSCEELHKRKLNMDSGKKVSFGETFYFH